MLYFFQSILSKSKYGLRAHHPGKRVHGKACGVREDHGEVPIKGSQVVVCSMVFLGGGFKDLPCSTPKNWEMIHFDSYFNQQDFSVLGYS